MPCIDSILLDRDGTIIIDKHYLCDPDGVELIAEAGEALAAACAAGKKLFVVTNQSGIGRGMFSEEQYQQCRIRLDEMLQADGAVVSASVHCPHTPDATPAKCLCRKPEIGMWRMLESAFSLNAGKSVMIGDKYADVAFGKNAGLAASILVLTGKGMAEAEKLGLGVQADEAAQLKGWVDIRKNDVSAAVGDTFLPDVVAYNLASALRWVTTVLEDDACDA
ncbi:D-glycero-alpha-D-manno-heptose-1,7-bisphosphate 7-phosphatase [Oleidesulfovibrio sp.]|uniref:D-glycero-alpha-D-manno-heptose-1,7-bisphosphate 7-phosphatase n=1 Tax=Oleidesulfovibrio sp. TaxID=2909707 RepID=UPI003A87F8CF